MLFVRKPLVGIVVAQIREQIHHEITISKEPPPKGGFHVRRYDEAQRKTAVYQRAQRALYLAKRPEPRNLRSVVDFLLG